MKILIAEDDLTSRTVLTAVLKKQGHEVEATMNGAEAWRAMQQPDAPRLAILDWMMPELDGVEVCRRIRALQTDQPPYIIMLTAKSEKENIVTGLEAGADDYLAKPFDAGELYARVEVGRRMLELQAAMADKVQELQNALNDVRTLRGIIPICASCKNIRDDRGYWNKVEAYIRDHSEAEFSHGICPECMKKLYPEFVREKTEGKS
ncbi:MAG: response regulator transcription factor [Deltaproteobacteria bacterium]|nr:response regulator transcription factor [Deltaproteobacteria bacterium]